MTDNMKKSDAGQPAVLSVRKWNGSGKLKDKSVAFTVISAVWISLFLLALAVPFYVIIITSLTPYADRKSTRLNSSHP